LFTCAGKSNWLEESKNQDGALVVAKLEEQGALKVLVIAIEVKSLLTPSDSIFLNHFK
jgi:hypothetical protein